MGLLTPRGQDDEEHGEIFIAGLDHLDGGDGDDEITFELDEWAERDLGMLRDRLVALGVHHTWEGTTLVIDEVDEAWVERIMDQVEEDLADAAGLALDDDVGGDEDEQVVYDLLDWDDESCMTLLDLLAAEMIPYDLDGDELLVDSADEARVDEIVAALTTPGATLTAGGPASFEAMSELFVAADQLRHDPDDKAAGAALVRGARAAAGATTPYGMAPGWWDGVVARAGALADLLESPSQDPDHVVEVASSLRDELRPVI
jgi:hypothetical protein